MANAAGVASMPIEQQVDALAQALLREYMHRKGFKRTLESFDKECPRTANTISSRNLMGQLMYLDVIQARNKARPSIDDNTTSPAAPPAEGLPLPRGPTFATIMEMLCSYRLRKRTIRHRRQQQQGSTDAENVPITDLQSFDSSDDEIVVSRTSAARQATIAEVKAAVAEKQAAKDARRAARRAAKPPPPAASSNGEDNSASTTGKTTKKDKKDKADKKDKRDKKSSSAPTSAPLEVDATSTEDPAARRPSRGGFDPLGASSGSVLTGSASSSTSSAPKGTVGRNWTPGGAAIAAPSVGVGLGGAAASAPPPEDARQVSYVAGAGMSLSTNAARGFTLDRAELSKTSGALGGKKVSASSAPGTGGESPPARSNSDTFDASPGDSGSSRAVYDPHATASGVLKRQEPAMSVIKQARAAVVAADMGVPPPAPSFADAGGGVAASAAGKREKKRVVVIDA